MNLYNSIQEFPSGFDTVVTIGTFDGLHVGHKHILERLNQAGKEKGLETVVLTFFPHPRHVLFPEDQNLKLLNTIDEKVEGIKKLGVQHFIIHKFTKEFSRTKSVNFIRDILVEKLRMKYMVVGYDHHFGSNRQGSFSELKGFSDLYDFELEEIKAQRKGGLTISSTKIRKALLLGDVKRANSFLGCNYVISGKVIHGNKLGRTIGFPTANIDPVSYKLLPKAGVYAVKIKINQSCYYGMLNIAINTYKVEVNIFEFSKDIYGKNIFLELVLRLRDGKDIKTLDSLKAQLTKDKIHCKRVLGC